MSIKQHAEEIISSINDLEWGDVRSMLDEYFPDGDVTDEIRKHLDSLAESDVVFDFSDGDGWGYVEKY